MANRTTYEIGFARYFKGLQTDAFNLIFETYNAAGSVSQDSVRESIETEGLEALSAARTNVQKLMIWLSEISPLDGQQKAASNNSATSVYFRIGYKDESDTAYWYARVLTGSVTPTAAHYDRAFSGKAAYRIEFERASAFQMPYGLLAIKHIGGAFPSEAGMGLGMSNTSANCTATTTTPAVGDTSSFSEIAIWNTTSGKSISRVLVGGQQASTAAPYAFSFGAISCAGAGGITTLASGAVDLSYFTTGMVKPVLRTDATGNPGYAWAANDMEFTLDNGATWHPIEYGHALSVGRAMRLPVPRAGWLPGVNPTFALKVRNFGNTRSICAGELYLIPCDLWVETIASTPAALNQAIIAGAYRGDVGTTGTGMNSGGDSYIANLDANGATVSVIPDCVNRKGEPPKFLPDRPYTLCALVEFSDGSAPASAAFKLRVTYLPRRRGL